MRFLSATERSVRNQIIDTILVAREEGESDEDIRRLVEDVFATTTEYVGMGPELYREETIHACFARQMEDIFTPDGIRLC